MKLKSSIAAAALAPALLLSLSVMPQAVAAPQHHHPGRHHTRCNYPPSKTTLTLSVARSHVRRGQQDAAFGALFNKRCRIGHAKIVIYIDGHAVGKTYTNRHGNYGFRFRVYHSESLQTAFGGNGQAGPATSRKVYVSVTPSRRHHHHGHHHGHDRNRHHHNRHHHNRHHR